MVVPGKTDEEKRTPRRARRYTKESRLDISACYKTKGTFSLDA